MPVLVDVHGSCVSRSCFQLVDKSQILIRNNFSRNSIVSCMMPPANISFQHGDLQLYNSEYSERCMRYALNKQTVPLLLESDSEYLIIDFFDFCQPVAAFLDTTFSTYDYTFYRTPAYREHKELFSTIDFLNVPICLWYGYVDAYFKEIDKKFHGKIILNRLNCSEIYLSKMAKIANIPQNLRLFGDPRYNQLLYALEDYIIGKYYPIVVDISKYFIPDESYNPDTTPVHFEKNYFVLQSQIMRRILLNGERGYFDVLPPSVISDLLSRPISNKDFCKVYSQRELPFNSDTVLDYIFQMQELEKIVANRKWIACIYQEYNEVSTRGGSGANAVKAILADSHLWKKDCTKESLFSNDVFQYLRRVDYCLQMAPSELYHLFEWNFESGNISEWMFLLNLLSAIFPNYRDVPSYLSQFYQTVADNGSLCKLSIEQYFYSNGAKAVAK